MNQYIGRAIQLTSAWRYMVYATQDDGVWVVTHSRPNGENKKAYVDKLKSLIDEGTSKPLLKNFVEQHDMEKQFVSKGTFNELYKKYNNGIEHEAEEL